MAEQKETIILDFQIEQGEAISELEKTKKAIILLKEEQAALNKAYKDGDKSIEEYSKESVKLEQSLKKETTTYNNLNKIVQTTSNSLEAQRLRLSQLTSERNKVDRSTADGVKRFNELNKSIKELNDTIKESEQAGGDFRRNVGNYSSAVEDFATNVKVGGVSLGDLTGKLTAFLNPATAASGLVAGLGALYVSSAAGARDLEFAQAQLGQSFKSLSNDLADLLGADGEGGGLLSKLAFQINAQFFGISNAAEGALSASAQKTLKELELTELEAARIAKKALDRAEVFRRIRDDDTKSFEERLKAARSVEAEITSREQALVDVQNKRLNALKSLLALDKENLDLQKEIKQTEFEIADIQEDSQGKQTEALNGINALIKEQNALKKESNALDQQAAGNAEQLAQVLQRVSEQRQQEIEQSPIVIKGKIDTGEAIKKLIDLENQKANNAKQKALIEDQIENQRIAGLQTTTRLATQLINEQTIAGKIAASAQATIDTYAAANLALKSFPPPLGAIAAALNVALGLANVAKINNVTAAAGGGDFVTKGPQLLLVGDNPGGRERVTVEPLSGRGRTVVGDGMIKLAGGGVVETQSATSSARSAFNFSNIGNTPVVYASWTEATQIRNKVEFKEKLTTA